MTLSLLFFAVEEGEDGERLDKFLARRIPEHSRTRLQSLIAEGHVFCAHPETKEPLAVNLRKTHHVFHQEVYGVRMPPLVETDLVPVSMDLHIYYEDDDIVVLEKPSDLVVHPSNGHREHTLVHGLLAHCGPSLSGISGIQKPGIVHRLDKETSGLMVIAKNDDAHHHLSQQFAERLVEKTYTAFVWKKISPAAGTIENFMGPHPKNPLKRAVVPETHAKGKKAITLYRTLGFYEGSHDSDTNIPPFSLVKCSIKTGRTHQIRVHFAHRGHPIVGDKIYGLPPSINILEKRHGLHASALCFSHPRTNEYLEFSSHLPENLQHLWHLCGEPALF